MAASVVSTDLDWRPLVRTDLLELSGLLNAIDMHDDPSERYTLDDLYEHYDADPEVGRNTMVAWAGHTAIAFGWNCLAHTELDPRRVFLKGGVHPGWRRMGLGRRVLQWQMDRAREWYLETWEPGFGPLHMIGNVDPGHHDRTRLFRRFAFRPVRWYADLTRPITGDLPDVPPPDGFRLVGYTDELAEPVRLAHNEAFADRWGARPVGPEQWAQECARPTFRPEWSWVLLDADGEVAGYAMSSLSEGEPPEGWTDRLGVRPAYRHRGLARSLLSASMRSFRDAGLEAAGLGVDVDGPPNARNRGFALYASMGYRTGDVAVMHMIEERVVEEHVDN